MKVVIELKQHQLIKENLSRYEYYIINKKKYTTDPWGDKRHQFSWSQLQDSLYFVVKIKTYMLSRFKEYYTHANTQK